MIDPDARTQPQSIAPREIELKLELDATDINALKANPALRESPAQTITQNSTYFDTPKAQLHRAGFALRVRRSGNRFVQTVKGESRAGGGLFDRAEWEQEISGAEPDFAALSAIPELRKIARKIDPAGLLPVFTADVARTAWRIEDGAHDIEMILDEGEILADGARTPILELELELKRGPPHDIFAFAHQLLASTPLRLGVLGKSERGYMLRDGALGKPVKALPVRLEPNMSAGQAFQTIASACIRQFRLNEPLFTNFRDSAALHQSRVGLRRLRSAFSIFAPITHDDRRDAVREELRWISSILGAARDLDVFVATRLGSDQAPREVRARALAERDAAFEQAIAALNSLRFQSFMLDLAEWLALGAWRTADHSGSADPKQPIEPFAQAALDRFWRKVKKRGRHLASLADEPRHQVRIAGKKLRYGSEFFASLFSSAKTAEQRQQFTAAIEDLQTHLGKLNDIATAGTLRDLLPGGERKGEPDRDSLLAQAEAAHTRLVAAGPFWR